MNAWSGSMLRQRALADLDYAVLGVMRAGREYTSEDIRNRLKSAGVRVTKPEAQHALNMLMEGRHVLRTFVRFHKSRVAVYRRPG